MEERPTTFPSAQIFLQRYLLRWTPENRHRTALVALDGNVVAT